MRQFRYAVGGLDKRLVVAWNEDKPSGDSKSLSDVPKRTR